MFLPWLRVALPFGGKDVERREDDDDDEPTRIIILQ